MNKSSYLGYFLALIKTKTYADEVISHIDELKENLYNRRVDLDHKMSELFSFEMKEKMKSLSWQEQVNLNDPESFGKFLLTLRNHIKNMAVVKIKIAVKPTDDVIDEISSWFMTHFGKHILVDLLFDKSLIAGAIIIFNDVEKDFSVIKRLAEKFRVEDWKKMVSTVINAPRTTASTDPQMLNPLQPESELSAIPL